MRVFVTGGTGFVGRAILARLAGRGHPARALVRSGRQPRAGLPGVEWAAGALLDGAGLVPLLRGCDAVIHLVGIISEAGPQTFERIHTEGTRSVVGAAQRAGVARFIHMSALGTRPGAASRYHRTKWAAEEIVRGSGLAWTIFRPSLIYGPGDGFTNLFARLSRWSPVLPVMGAGTARLQPVGVGAVSQAFVGALERPESTGRTYDLAGAERLTFNEVLAVILAALGRRRFMLHLPLPLARAQAALLETVCPALLRRPPPLNRDQILMLQEDNVGEPAPADALFGLRHEPFGEALRRQLAAARPGGGKAP
jgi:NADH dehydrogenase